MNDGIAQMISLGGLTLPEAIATATINPARLIHLTGREQGLTEGQAGDVVAFRQTANGIEIDAVYLNGRRLK